MTGGVPVKPSDEDVQAAIGAAISSMEENVVEEVVLEAAVTEPAKKKKKKTKKIKKKEEDVAAPDAASNAERVATVVADDEAVDDEADEPETLSKTRLLELKIESIERQDQLMAKEAEEAEEAKRLEKEAREQLASEQLALLRARRVRAAERILRHLLGDPLCTIVGVASSALNELGWNDGEFGGEVGEIPALAPMLAPKRSVLR